MPSQRRYSGPRNDEFSLEQRLVMQLSAAINQEDNGERHLDQQNAIEDRYHDHEVPTHQNESAIDFAALLGSLDSVLGGHSDHNESQDHQPGSHAVPQPSTEHSGPSSVLQEKSKPAESTTSVSQSIAPSNQEVLDVNAILATLNPRDAGFTNDSGAINSVLESINSGADHSGTIHSGTSHSETSHSGTNYSGADSSRTIHSGADSSRTIHSGADSSRTIHSGTDNSGVNSSSQPQNSDHTVPSSSELGTLDLGRFNELLSGLQTQRRASAGTGPSSQLPRPQLDRETATNSSTPTQFHPQFDATILSSMPSIDPDVSSIQSVLQMLLTGGSVEGLSDSKASSSAASNNEADSAQEQSRPTIPASSNTVPTAKQDNQTFFGLELGAEEQSLIQTLKNAMNSATSTISSYDDVHRALEPNHLTGTSASGGRVQKPRETSPRMRQKPRSSYSSDRLSSSQLSSYQSDFNASDPDTLRAIQQALLSAMGPSASSTSLAETLTSAEPSSSLVSKTSASSTPPSGPSLAPAPPRSLHSENLDSIEKRLSMPSLPRAAFPPRFRSESVSSSGSTQDSRQAKPPAKFSLPKPAKVSEADRQKQREENNARKRKWREMNHLQNRDRDLRLRIVKRANELFGESESTDKSAWVEQEFNRRRHRRILRAGIHSIVESARARALKAQENGAALPLDGHQQRLAPGGGTLTQQSKQAASSHLSQLFKNSNAALEPQLHSEKLTVPLAPYMLIASPRRPPFKMNWPPKAGQSQDESGIAERQESGNDTDPGTDGKEKTPEELEGIDKEPSKKDDTEASVTDDIETQANEKPKESSGEAEEAEKAEPKSPRVPTDLEKALSPPKSDEPADLSRVPSEGATGDSGSKASEVCGENAQDPALDRPKHRYGLIGNLKLGIPPNLTAIYRKIRGRPPLQVNVEHETAEHKTAEHNTAEQQNAQRQSGPPQPGTPEPPQSEPAQPEPVQPEPVQPEPAQSEPAQSEPAQSEPAQSEPLQEKA